jgi:acyl-CoA synthetase (AMP-forming)/AMP-acid ligase II/thioesterase domain-containing protein
MGSSQLAALDAIERYALSRPESLALLEPDGLILNYKELWEQVQMVSERLEEAGIGAGERVVALLPQGGLHVLAVTGVLNRHVVILLSERTAPTAVESTLRKLSASALIAASEFETEIKVAIGLGLTVLVARKGESPKDWQIRAAAFRSNRSLAPSRPGLFLFSSGTTGASKIVFWNDANVNAGIASRQRSAQLTGSDRLLLMITLCNGAGIINALTQFNAGGLIIATSGFDHSAYVRWLNQLKPTWYVCAPIVHQASLAALKEETIDLPVSLRFLESAGAPLNREVRQELEQILGVPVLNVYGANEVQYVARKALSSDGRDPNPDSAGVSCGLEISIMDSFGKLLPNGEEGEIAVRGETVASGYVDNPEATRVAFQDGWFKTGDAGHLDDDGNLFVTGRLKEMINRGGEKIVPSEVDEVFASHPAVLEAAAFAVPHPTLGEDVACAVVLRAGTESQVSAHELRRYAKQHLASFKVPHRIHFVDEIPRGELGKPLRWVLAERLGNNHSTPPTPAEITELSTVKPLVVNLHEIWTRILDRDDLGFDEDFFDAGGDSLAAINMLAEVDKRFGSQTSAQAASFLDEPTLLHLASLVGRQSPPINEDSSEIKIFPVRTDGTSMHLFCVPDNGVEGLYFFRLAKHLSGKIDCSIVRPANTLHSASLFTFEYAGKKVAEAIRRARPEGPYFIAGYCFGGIVAFEAARQLSTEGQDVRAILFDVPMPACSGLLVDRRAWLAGAKRQWHRLWTSDHPGITRNLRRFSCRFAWSVSIVCRRFLSPIANVAVARHIVDWSEIDGFPLYKATPVDAPLLHILSTDDPREGQPRQFDPTSRFLWRPLARRGIEERYIPLDHYNVFYESNLPVIAETISRWCGASNEAEEFAQASSKKNDFS